MAFRIFTKIFIRLFGRPIRVVYTIKDWIEGDLPHHKTHILVAVQCFAATFNQAADTNKIPR